MPRPPRSTRTDTLFTYSTLFRSAAVVALDERDGFRNENPLLEAPADPQCRLKAEGDLGQHVSELHLDELRCRQRAPELLAVQRILARGLIAGLRRAHASPRSEEHTSELQSLMRISYAVFCLNK